MDQSRLNYRLNYWHPVRLFALCSLFSLLAIRTGDLAFLWYLLFLLFLLPVPLKRSERATGFLPFVNEGGRRVVRWYRLALVWVFVMAATTLATSCWAPAAHAAVPAAWKFRGFALDTAGMQLHQVLERFAREYDVAVVFDVPDRAAEHPAEDLGLLGHRQRHRAGR